MAACLRYSPTVEEILDGEAETFAKIAEKFGQTGETVATPEGRRRCLAHTRPTRAALWRVDRR